MAFPAPSLLTAHKAPALLVVEVLDASETGGCCRLLAGLDRWQLLEAATQAAAVIKAAAVETDETKPTRGMLVGLKQVHWLREVDAEPPCEARVTHAASLGGLHAFAITVTQNNEPVLETSIQVHHEVAA